MREERLRTCETIYQVPLARLRQLTALVDDAVLRPPADGVGVAATGGLSAPCTTLRRMLDNVVTRCASRLYDGVDVAATTSSPGAPLATGLLMSANPAFLLPMHVV